MSFNSDGLTDDPIQRVRLLTGDIGDEPILDDGVYEYQIFLSATENGAAIELLTNIINFIVLNPTVVSMGDVKQVQYDLDAFERRLAALVEKDAILVPTAPIKVPVIIRTGRADWSDFNFLQYK